MDNCAAVLLSFPPDGPVLDNVAYDGAIRAHYDRVEQLFKDQGVNLMRFGEDLLDLLNPATNSLSYLSILELLLPVDPRQAAYQPALAERIVRFLRSFDPRQLRYRGPSFVNLFTSVGTGHVLPPAIAVPLLADALLKLDPSGSMLTSNHLILMRLAYHTGVIEPVLRVAEKPILHVPNMINPTDEKHVLLCDPALPPPAYISKETGLTTRLTPMHVMEYEWLVGMAFSSQRDWAKARTAFARAASHPARDSGVSKLMVESYKKWLLVSLLASGIAGTAPTIVTPATGGVAGGTPVPPLTTSSATRAFNVLGRAYIQIADCYRRLDAVALRDHVLASMAQFADDGNEGLVRETLHAHQKWQIMRLRDVYARVSLAEINAVTKSAVTGAPLASEAELRVLLDEMIASGMLRAVVEPAASAAGDGSASVARLACLTFLPTEGEELSETELAVQIKDATGRLLALGAAHKAGIERFTTSKEYAKHTIKEQKRGGGERGDSGKDAGIGGPHDWASADDDEDLMAGVVAQGA